MPSRSVQTVVRYSSSTFLSTSVAIDDGLRSLENFRLLLALCHAIPRSESSPSK
jgi:hypothetical protein